MVVVLAARRYGWVPPDQGENQHQSITWLECQHAESLGKELLAFLVDDKQPWPAEATEEYRLTAAIQNGTADEALFREVNRNVALLKEFKVWLNARSVRATFTTPENLRRCVAEALHAWLRRHPHFEPAQPARRPPADPIPYLRDLVETTAYIDIRGLSVGTGQAHRFPIEQLFISLTTTHVPSAAGARGAGAAA